MSFETGVGAAVGKVVGSVSSLDGSVGTLMFMVISDGRGRPGSVGLGGRNEEKGSPKSGVEGVDWGVVVRRGISSTP